MTVALLNSSVTYDGDDFSTVFATTFKFLDPSELLIEQQTAPDPAWRTLTLGVEVDSIDGAGADEPGGSITLDDPLDGESTLRITRVTRIVQPLVLQQSGTFPPKSIALELDRVTLICQELARRVAALEALSQLVDVSTLADGVVLSQDFETSDPVEDTFLLNFACPSARNAIGCILLACVNRDDGTVRFDEPPQIQWRATAGAFLAADTLNIVFVSGLAASTNYRLRVLVLFP